MKKPNYSTAFAHYSKALARLHKNLRSGQFTRYTQQKKWLIWNRLCRYARQVGVTIKAPTIAACLAAGFTITSSATAQTLVKQTTILNPLGTVAISNLAAPAFVDIDQDGDKDVFIGSFDGTLRYYQNDGNSLMPLFLEKTGEANPFDGKDVGYYSFPNFVDIDHDGDMDVFVARDGGTISYFENTGTATSPLFTERTYADNPLSFIEAGWILRPGFVDIDGDGDTDVFFGSLYSPVYYYKNTGTATIPVFTQQFGTDNPLNGATSSGEVSNVSFGDLDRDGDMDAFIGSDFNGIYYYKNTGTALVPVFTLETGLNNPLNSVNGNWPATAYVDIDGDTDLDIFVGIANGTIDYYQNTSAILPLHLLGFSGSTVAGYNQLFWQTTDEINTKLFEIEMSSDGRAFSKILTIPAVGSGNHNYSAKDNTVFSGKVFYRVKMIDANGSYTYSQIIFITSGKGGIISLYPNPVADVININIGGANILKTKAGIYDVKGRLLQNVLIGSNQVQVNVQMLPKGLYTMKFADGTVQSFIKR